MEEKIEKMQEKFEEKMEELEIKWRRISQN